LDQRGRKPKEGKYILHNILTESSLNQKRRRGFCHELLSVRENFADVSSNTWEEGKKRTSNKNWVEARSGKTEKNQ